ncbi:molybdate/tungstate transport system permease protein [Desulfomicrobium macestii]|uniref:Molybdate/tungstate transport system permease protein n=2 Tax=Desulfomicrobium TaxID=898 RepID=A0A8G2C093_DESNO|nr:MULTISPECIES: ABC transporter permease [Desulfomicrobium]MBE1423823.1 molybdate/tungstate transport system permease protein [Desulfomicrobium macestii]SFL31987.1 molybdate/tungstate transport system permease protein [Desulfomicrobium norvegicum]
MGSLPGRVFQFWLIASCILVLVFIVAPLARTVVSPDAEQMWKTLGDPDVLRSVGLSMGASAMAAVLSLIMGTPLAYILARREFAGKKIVESLIDLPIMIPHPVIGIAFLTLAGRNNWFGGLLASMGIEMMGTVTGITVVLFFVGLPFYINTAKAGFESVAPRLEKVSRSLGAGPGATFFRVTLPLCRRAMLVGMIMCMARALSEFGAVVIVAYHPMIAPVLMFERFTAYGLKYSQPVAVILIVVSLLFFIALRVVSRPQRRDA